MILPALDLVLEDGVVLIDVMARLDPEDLWLTEGPRWRSLVGDLARLRAGWRPDATRLDRAPILTGWSITNPGGQGLVRLLGTVNGHPNVEDDRLVRTSPLMALDMRALRWARTASRFYRLGPPDLKT